MMSLYNIWTNKARPDIYKKNCLDQICRNISITRASSCYRILIDNSIKMSLQRILSKLTNNVTTSHTLHRVRLSTMKMYCNS